MPGLVNDAGLLGFAVGIAQIKAIAPGIGHKPLLGGGVFLLLVQQLIVHIHQVHSQTQLMLAGAREGADGSSHDLRLFPGKTVGHLLLHLLFIQPLLVFMGAVGRADDGGIACGLAIGQHLLQRVVALHGNLVAAGVGDQFHHIIVRDGVPGVHQQNFLAVFQEVVGL